MHVIRRAEHAGDDPGAAGEVERDDGEGGK